MPRCQICSRLTGCTCKGSWRNLACSPEHFQEYLQKNAGGMGNLSYKLRAFDGKAMWDIVDYVIETDNVKMVTDLENKSIYLRDTEYVIVLDSEKENLLKSYTAEEKYVKVNREDYDSKIKFLDGTIVTNNNISLSDDSSSDIEISTETGADISADIDFETKEISDGNNESKNVNFENNYRKKKF